MRITNRIKHAWNAFTTPIPLARDYGHSSSRAPHKSNTVFRTSTYVSPIFNRIAMDVSVTTFEHVKVNSENEDITTVNSGLNYCLNTEANIDQTHIQFIHDLVYSMFDEGVVAVVPVDTSKSPNITESFDIHSLRVGKIVNWFPKHVEINLYNDQTGQNERIMMSKTSVAIVENPLYAVVNDENSTLKRLIRKLNQLDNVDDLVDSSRLDLIIGVPYGIKTTMQRAMAEQRIKDIEMQLSLGRNGIAYIDATEKVTQLNRPSNSQLLENINTLTQQFYNQLGLTQSIFDGTASETELRTYYSRTIDPIIMSVVAEFIRKFLTKTARTQGHTIHFYRDMFKLVTVEQISALSDTLRRNYIASANEIRKIIKLKPSNDPRADELFNPNIADNKQDKPSVGSKKSIEEEDDVKDKEEVPGLVTPPDTKLSKS